MNNISILLLTKNEQENLKQWGGWIHKLTNINEIVVIDDESTDNTINILKSLATKKLSINIFKRKLENDFAKQRNFGLTKCKNNWVFSIDADETLTDTAIEYINKLDVAKGQNYAFKRNIIYLGHTISHGQCIDDSPIKLFNKNEGKFVNPVHEIWESESITTDTYEAINHYSIKSLSLFLEKINQYSSIRAQELFDQGHKPHLWEIILYPKLKFIDLYILKFGFLDGTTGIILSLAMAFNSFLVRSKLWHLSQK